MVPFPRMTPTPQSRMSASPPGSSVAGCVGRCDAVRWVMRMRNSLRFNLDDIFRGDRCAGHAVDARQDSPRSTTSSMPRNCTRTDMVSGFCTCRPYIPSA